MMPPPGDHSIAEHEHHVMGNPTKLFIEFLGGSPSAQ
jgi:hypothetical protein